MCVCSGGPGLGPGPGPGDEDDQGFGISVNLERYFGDERRRIMVWVRPRQLGTVAGLAHSLRTKMTILGPLCLIKDGHLLPQDEDCRLIRAGDVIQVIPLAKDFALPREDKVKDSERKNTKEISRAVSADKENLTPINNDSIEKESKKKKRKKQKETANEVAIPIETEEKNMKCDGQEKYFHVLTTILQDLSGKNQRSDDDGDAKSKNVANKDHININGVTDGRITKRKRVRVRKNKQNKQIETNISDDESSHSLTSSTFSTPVNNKNSHLRFSSNDIASIPPTITRNSVASNGIGDKPRIVHAVKVDGPYVNKKEETSSNKSESEYSLDVIMNEIVKYPLYNDENPKENDIVVFKTLKMDENYTPTVSKLILGRILKFNAPDMNTRILLLDGHKECSFPTGKFDVPAEDEENQCIETIDILWNQTIAARKVNF